MNELEKRAERYKKALEEISRGFINGYCDEDLVALYSNIAEKALEEEAK